ncbi:hypothetical protein GUJ93_ZPchr0006g46161 [Zizania palustris]|uniref:Uncharacterized protein n=1 Tax=Zizania palustris TaxID=103762 RepID=A0A8J5SYD7_ZIZPA|nr:hypothetical protein GUJ93_ZPchr0006g46161 [Zizania palustris]
MAPTVSTSVPLRPARSPSAGGHMRSASLPCHSHPLVTHVDDQLLALRSWTSNPGQNPLSLAHVRALLCVLEELLHLPLAAAAASTDRLLHGFLVLADAFGSFLAALLSIRQHAAELQAAVRRRDQAKIASAARAQSQVYKELAQLAAGVARKASRCARPSVTSCTEHAGATELEVARTVAQAINDTAVASASVFIEVGSLADAAAAATAPPPTNKRLSLMHTWSRSNKAASCEEQREVAALQKLKDLEQCIGELESESEKVFRSLVQARVSLLNIHTQLFY